MIKMQLYSINIKNLRSINRLNMNFKPGINLIYGKNGIGKTSMLEAMYILSISRSFRSHLLKNIITDGHTNIEIVGKIKDSKGTSLKIEYYKLKNQKRIKINEKKINNLSELLGVFPATILSPENINIVIGTNKDKQTFFNMILCHTNKTYLINLKRYKQTLKQRNVLLQTNPSNEYLKTWDKKLSSLANNIWELRKIFLRMLYVVSKTS